LKFLRDENEEGKRTAVREQEIKMVWLGIVFGDLGKMATFRLKAGFVEGGEKKKWKFRR
jgi:hypothetical protein